MLMADRMGLRQAWKLHTLQEKIVSELAFCSPFHCLCLEVLHWFWQHSHQSIWDKTLVHCLAYSQTKTTWVLIFNKILIAFLLLSQGNNKMVAQKNSPAQHILCLKYIIQNPRNWMTTAHFSSRGMPTGVWQKGKITEFSLQPWEKK